VGVAWLQDSVVEGGAPALLQPKLEAGRRQGARAVLLDLKVGLGDLPSTLATVAVVKVSGGAFWSSKGGRWAWGFSRANTECDAEGLYHQSCLQFMP
jgi:hypothetical protein